MIPLVFFLSVAMFSFGWLVEDLQESILAIYPPAQKATLEHHYNIIQSQINEKIANNETVPDELILRANEKKAKAEAIDTSINPILNMINQIKYAPERDKVKEAILDFRSGDYNTDELQARVDSFQIVIDNCPNGLSIPELENNRKSAYDIVQQRCPELSKITGEKALQILNDS